MFSSWTRDACAFALVDHLLDDGSGVDLLSELSLLDPVPSMALISRFLSSEVASRAFKSHALPMAPPTDIETLRELLELLERVQLPSLATSRSSKNQPRTSEPPPSLKREPLVFQPFTLSEGMLRTPLGAYRLRSAESRLLSHLVRRRPRVVSPQELARSVLGRDDETSRRCIYSHVANLRLRLGRYGSLIETEHKQGYRLALDVFEGHS